MARSRVSKSEFKAKALEYFRELEATGDSLIVTDRGKPTLEIRPYLTPQRDALEFLRGSVVRYDAPVEPLDVAWDAAL